MEEIGKDCFGTVHKGNGLALMLPLKKIHSAKKQKSAHSNLVQKETEILSRLRHPNLVQLMAYLIEPVRAYIVMEHIKGYDLESLIFPEEATGRNWE